MFSTNLHNFNNISQYVTILKMNYVTIHLLKYTTFFTVRDKYAFIDLKNYILPTYLVSTVLSVT